MPVTKYRSVEGMPRPGRVPDDELADRIRGLWRRARLLAPPASFTRGVQRFRSVEELNEARARATLRRMSRSAG